MKNIARIIEDLMVAVTFAEAGVTDAISSGDAQTHYQDDPLAHTL